MSTFARALRILDDVQHLPQILDELRALLCAVDRHAEKCMRIRLGRLEALPAQLRTLFATTVLAYEHDLPRLRARAAAALARTDPAGAGDTTARLVAAAEQTLATRAALRDGVLRLGRDVATAWLPAAERAARDRSQPDEQLDRWRRARVDLASLAELGDTLALGTFAERLDRMAPPGGPPEDPPEEERPHRFALIELD
jgi:hypothetical protein